MKITIEFDGSSIKKAAVCVGNLILDLFFCFVLPPIFWVWRNKWKLIGGVILGLLVVDGWNYLAHPNYRHIYSEFWYPALGAFDANISK